MEKPIVINIGSLIKNITFKGKFSKKQKQNLKAEVSNALLNAIDSVKYK